MVKKKTIKKKTPKQETFKFQETFIVVPKELIKRIEDLESDNRDIIAFQDKSREELSKVEAVTKSYFTYIESLQKNKVIEYPQWLDKYFSKEPPNFNLKISLLNKAIEDLSSRLRRLESFKGEEKLQVVRPTIPTHITADNRMIPVPEMDTRHLKNVVKCIRRGRSGYGFHNINVYLDELINRGVI